MDSKLYDLRLDDGVGWRVRLRHLIQRLGEHVGRLRECRQNAEDFDQAFDLAITLRRIEYAPMRTEVEAGQVQALHRALNEIEDHPRLYVHLVAEMLSLDERYIRARDPDLPDKEYLAIRTRRVLNTQLMCPQYGHITAAVTTEMLRQVRVLSRERLCDQVVVDFSIETGIDDEAVCTLIVLLEQCRNSRIRTLFVVGEELRDRLEAVLPDPPAIVPGLREAFRVFAFRAKILQEFPLSNRWG